ncbi:MAG: hypothetical protein PUG74_11565 [Prevotellaceae bacterium]|nr:hypothetical protein [Prevotellaceae bacterium]
MKKYYLKNLENYKLLEKYGLSEEKIIFFDKNISEDETGLYTTDEMRYVNYFRLSAIFNNIEKRKNNISIDKMLELNNKIYSIKEELGF